MRRRQRVWIRGLKIAIAILVLVGLASMVRNCVGDLAHSPLQLTSIRWPWLFVSGGAYSLGMMMAGLFWHQVLSTLGQRVSLPRSLAAFFVSQLGKYLPGKAMVIVLRAALIRAPYVNTQVAVVAVFVETLTWMAIAAAMGSATLIAIAPQQQWLLWAGATMSIVAFSVVSPPVLRWVLLKLRRKEIERAGLVETRISFAVLGLGWVEMVIGWSLVGFSLWAVLQAMPDADVHLRHFWLALACATLSVVLGFVSLIPGGLGVRELVIAPLLATEFGAPIALTAAVILRLVWLTAELILAGIMQGCYARRSVTVRPEPISSR